MRHRLPNLIAVCLLLLALVQPRPHHGVPPPVVTPTRMAPDFDWGPMQRALDERTLADFYAWAASQSPPKVKPGRTHARASADVHYEAVSYEPGSIESIICSVFGDNCAHALRIARCESGLNPSAYNRSGASGLFQIMMPMHTDLFNRPEDVFDPLENSRAAFGLSHGGTNWSAWVCR